MTRERAKELLPIITAYAEGTEIESYDGLIWYTVENTTFSNGLYRIKPEKKYRPFASAEEFKPHRDRWIIFKDVQDDGVTAVKIYGYNNKDVKLSSVYLSHSYAFLLENYTFEDGSPCGVEVEE